MTERWNARKEEERGGERSQHISLNKRKVESSDHQLVRECLINIVMRPQVCRAIIKGERSAPLSPSRLSISSNHMYLGCSFMKTELALSLCVGLSVESAWRWPLSVMPQG